jgi:hypothetical protein
MGKTLPFFKHKIEYNVSSKITAANENVNLWKHWYQTNIVSGQKEDLCSIKVLLYKTEDWMMFNNQEWENGFANIWKESWKTYRSKQKRLFAARCFILFLKKNNLFDNQTQKDFFSTPAIILSPQQTILFSNFTLLINYFTSPLQILPNTQKKIQ